MLEIFLRDRDIDYDMFVYHNEKFHYITKEKNKKNNALYCGLSTGTIILDGVVLNNTLTNLEQINYIKEILNSFADIVDAYRGLSGNPFNHFIIKYYYFTNFKK